MTSVVAMIRSRRLSAALAFPLNLVPRYAPWTVPVPGNRIEVFDNMVSVIEAHVCHTEAGRKLPIAYCQYQ